MPKSVTPLSTQRETPVGRLRGPVMKPLLTPVVVSRTDCPEAQPFKAVWIREVSRLDSLGGVPVTMAKLAVSVAQAAGIVGSAGSVASIVGQGSPMAAAPACPPEPPRPARPVVTAAAPPEPFPAAPPVPAPPLPLGAPPVLLAPPLPVIIGPWFVPQAKAPAPSAPAKGGTKTARKRARSGLGRTDIGPPPRVFWPRKNGSWATALPVGNVTPVSSLAPSRECA